MTLKQFMDLRGLKDADVAEATGLTVATINRLKHGKHRPSWNTLWTIAKFTKGKVAPTDWLS